jgi:hypothetical protein
MDVQICSIIVGRLDLQRRAARYADRRLVLVQRGHELVIGGIIQLERRRRLCSSAADALSPCLASSALIIVAIKLSPPVAVTCFAFERRQELNAIVSLRHVIAG